jgi:hypothetical protein
MESYNFWLCKVLVMCKTAAKKKLLYDLPGCKSMNCDSAIGENIWQLRQENGQAMGPHSFCKILYSPPIIEAKEALAAL